jgi:hypothetical protein
MSGHALRTGVWLPGIGYEDLTGDMTGHATVAK